MYIFCCITQILSLFILKLKGCANPEKYFDLTMTPVYLWNCDRHIQTEYVCDNLELSFFLRNICFVITQIFIDCIYIQNN